MSHPLAMRFPPTTSGPAPRLVRASSDFELRAAAAFRRTVFLHRRRIMFDEVLEARRDRAGHVFLLLEDDRLVATARVLPYPSALSTLDQVEIGRGPLDADSEVGRIAAVRSPESIRYSLSLLALGAAWMVQNTGLQRYAAYCHPRLLDLYRSVGAKVVGGPCNIAGRPEPHHVIVGRYQDAAVLALRPRQETTE